MGGMRRSFGLFLAVLLMLSWHASEAAAALPPLSVPPEALFGTVYCTPQDECVYGAAPSEAYAPAAQVAVNNNGEPVNGWDVLVVRAVTTNPVLLLGTQYYAMGYAEGFVTSQRIYQTYLNQQIAGQRANFSSYVSNWVNDHVAYMRNNTQRPADEYWAEVALVLRQLDGLTAGFNAAASVYNIHLDFMDIFLISFLFEIGDVVLAMQRLHGSSSEMSDFQKRFYKGFTSHCSALIKPVPGDFLVTHTTWGSLESMLRQYKVYQIGEYSIAFSSYPGTLHSGDDIYVTSTGFAVLETTNENYNNETAPYVVPSSVSEFIRVMVSNRMAVNGSNWGATFCRENSGTYNNQWMIVDLNVIQGEASASGKPLDFAVPGSLQVIEQMPYMCLNADQSAFSLNQTYWSSFNRPFYPDMFQWAGTAAMLQQHGDYFSYYQNYRRLIFERNQSMVTDVETMQNMIRFNNYLNDPLSVVPYKKENNCSGFPTRNAETSISARADLTPLNSNWCDLTFDIGAQDLAGIDGKIISLRSVFEKGIGMWLVNGPTNGGLSDLPVFSWNTSLYDTLVPHHGMPDTFNFPWVDGTSQLLASISEVFPPYATTNHTLEVVYDVPAAEFEATVFSALVLSLIQSQVAPSDNMSLPPPKYAALRGAGRLLGGSNDAAVVIEGTSALSAAACNVKFHFVGSSAVRNTIIFSHTLTEEFAAYGLAPVETPAGGSVPAEKSHTVAIAVGCSVGAVVLAATISVILRRSQSTSDDSPMKDVSYTKL